MLRPLPEPQWPDLLMAEKHTMAKLQNTVLNFCAATGGKEFKGKATEKAKQSFRIFANTVHTF